MHNQNEATLIGNISSDIETRVGSNGTKIATFNLATNHKYRQDDQVKEETDYHRLVAFGKTAELAEQHLKKGAYIQARGRIKTRSWTDDNDVKRYTTEIILGNIGFLSKKGPAGNDIPQGELPDHIEDDPNS